MDELEWFRQAIVRAYPNPDRIGCAAPEALEGMARRTVPMGTAEQDHIFHCSPCFSTYLGIRNQMRRQRVIRAAGIWAAAAVLVVAIAYSGFRIFFGSPSPQQFTTVVNMEEHPVFRGIHQAATHPSPFVFPRGIVHMALTLPLASEPGVYQVEICRDGQTEPLVATSGQAVLRSDGSTLLKVDLDTYKLRSGKYALGVRKDDAEWSYSPLVLP
jgi:hypothetical protein